MSISPSPKCAVSKDLLLCTESGAEVTPYPDQQLLKCPPFAGAQPCERLLQVLRPAAGDRLFEGASSLCEVDAEATGVCRVLATLHRATSLEPPQHLGDGGGSTPKGGIMETAVEPGMGLGVGAVQTFILSG
jgi:hypothetical protein